MLKTAKSKTTQSKTARPVIALPVAALLGVLLTGCVSAPQQRQTVRICTGGECSVQDASVQTFVPQDDPRASPPRDPDSHAGESRADLQAAAASGDSVAAYKLGMAALSGTGAPKSAETAARWFRQAADGGHAWAAYRLGEMYRSGRGVQRDRQLALRYLTAAASARQPLAANALGVMALTGDGLPKDSAQAVQWFAIAAEQGVADAQYNLALLTFNGDGVPRDLSGALEWMRYAGGNGNVKAQGAVGRLYLTGLDTMGQDFTEAKTWLSLAARNGDREAGRLLEEAVRLEKEEQDYRRRLAEQSAQTMAYWAQALYVRELNTTTVYHYWYW